MYYFEFVDVCDRTICRHDATVCQHSINLNTLIFSGTSYGSGLRRERHGKLHVSRGKNGKRTVDGTQRYRRHLRQNTVGQGNSSLSGNSRHRYGQRYVPLVWPLSIELCGTIILRQGTNFVFSIMLSQPLPRRLVTFIRYVVLLALAFRNESSVTRIRVRKEEPREQCVSPALSRPHRGGTTQKRKWRREGNDVRDTRWKRGIRKKRSSYGSCTLVEQGKGELSLCQDLAAL